MQRRGLLEEALPCVRRSVEPRRDWHLLRLSLGAMANLCLEMLALVEAEQATARLLYEELRYDAEEPTRIALEIPADVQAERRVGTRHGLEARLHGLRSRPDLNEAVGETRGNAETEGRYDVVVGGAYLSIHRSNLDGEID